MGGVIEIRLHGSPRFRRAKHEELKGKYEFELLVLGCVVLGYVEIGSIQCWRKSSVYSEEHLAEYYLSETKGSSF